MKIYLTLAVLLLSTSLFAQKKKSYPPPPGLNEKPVRVNKEKYSLKKRLAFYPFNQCVQVKLVSFGPTLDTSQMFPEKEYRLPISHDTICFSKLAQEKSLTLLQIDTLTDILYNECNRWTMYSSSAMGCYQPRNAVLFLNNKGEVFEYLEICFECHQEETKTPDFKSPDYCEYVYERLECFFQSAGVYTKEEQLPVRMK